jgi:hypothetical protein
MAPTWHQNCTRWRENAIKWHSEMFDSDDLDLSCQKVVQRHSNGCLIILWLFYMLFGTPEKQQWFSILVVDLL